MTLLLLNLFLKHKNRLLKSKLAHLFLILIAMFVSSSANPQVVADFTTLSANTGCGSLVVEFQDLSTGNPDTWLWDFGNGNVSNLKNPTAIYANPGIYDVSLTASNSSSNNVKIVNALIKVHDEPTSVISINSSANGCIPHLVNFEDNSVSSSSIVDWQWDFGDGGGSNIQNPDYNFLYSGAFSVSLLVTDLNGCQNLATEINYIQADDSPLSSFIADIPFSCNPTELVSFTNNTTGGVTYLWDFGDGTTSVLENPSHFYTSGIYSVSLSSKKGGCVDTLVLNDYIKVGEELNTSFSTNISAGCEGTTFTFTDQTANNPDAWLWDFGDGNFSIQQNPTHTYQTSGVFDVSLTTSKNGDCHNIKTINNAIEIYANPVVQIFKDTSYACSVPFSVEFNDVTVDAVDWQWDFGNGNTSNAQNPVTDFTSFGEYDVTLSITNSKGCTETEVFLNEIVVEKIEVDILESIASGCLPLSTEFFEMSNSSRPLTNWEWDFGDGNISNNQNPQHTYNSAGNFDVKLLVTNDYGCVADTLFPGRIIVEEAPQTNFEATPIVSCAGENIIFNDITISNSPITNWEWNFGDGSSSNLQNPTYQYQLTGLYDVSLITGTNFCKDTFVINDYIKIMEPTSIFLERYSCDNPLTVEFDNFSIGADNVYWDFGDGNTSSALNPIHTYQSTGTYFVELTVENIQTGCSHKSIRQVNVTIPIADFTYLPNTNNVIDSVVCKGNRVYLENNSQDLSYYRVLWSDGYIGYGRIDHLFDTTGIFSVTMVITDIHGCKDTATHTNMYEVVDVEADFQITNVLGCDSMLVEFENLSSAPSDLTWSFGDGGSSTLNNPTHIYYNEGIYDVALYVKSNEGCKDTLERLEYIQFQYPTANFVVSSQGVCPDDVIQFSNLSDGIAIDGVWDFGDGTQSTQINPTHSFALNGQYDISLMVTDSFGCSNSLVLPGFIDVLEPTADFITAGLSANCPPLISNFTNTSTADVTNWEWNFSDGSSSNLEDPSHLFSVSGNFDVSLVVTNQYGCKDTLVQQGLIDISGPTGSFTISDTLVCVGEDIQFVPNVNNTDLFLWDFGNGVSSTDSFPTQIYNTGGVFLPSLVIENASGCQFTINNFDTIVVKAVSVDAGFDVEICEGEKIQLNAIGTATQYNWFPAINIINSSSSNPVVNPITDITYFVNHTDNMCSAVDSIFVKVNNDVPAPNFTTSNHCDGDTTIFLATSGLISQNVAWEWSFGSTHQNPSQQLNLGLNNISLIVKNLDNNCVDTLVQQVDIKPLPVANFEAVDACLGEVVVFTNTSSSDVVGWEYNMGDGVGTSTLESPNYTYLNPGVFFPSLLVTSNFGCKSIETLELEINDLPIANFLVLDKCLGEESEFINNSSLSSGSIVRWEYNFGDGTANGISEDEIHEYTSPGLYNVVLNVISDKGCIASIEKETRVYDTPKVDFLSEENCIGATTSFTNNTFLDDGDGVVVEWNWNFGDSSGFSNFEHPFYNFNSSGEFLVSLSATSNFGCSSSVDKIVNISPLPLVDFSTIEFACVGEEIQFNNLSSASSGIVSSEWSFGDSKSSNDNDPAHAYNYANSFDVNLQVTSGKGCKNDITILNAITIHANPIADFSASDFNVSEFNSEIEFYNTSKDAVIFNWDFDNGLISTEENPIVDFEDVQSYEVLLQVISSNGCVSEAVKNINVSPEFTVFVPNAFTPNGDGNNDVFMAKGNGIANFEMQIFDRWGGIIFESNNIENGWNGLDASSNIVGVGTYMYHIALYDYNGKLWIYNGEFNLLR